MTAMLTMAQRCPKVIIISTYNVNFTFADANSEYSHAIDLPFLQNFDQFDGRTQNNFKDHPGPGLDIDESMYQNGIAKHINFNSF